MGERNRSLPCLAFIWVFSSGQMSQIQIDINNIEIRSGAKFRIFNDALV